MKKREMETMAIPQSPAEHVLASILYCVLCGVCHHHNHRNDTVQIYYVC